VYESHVSSRSRARTSLDFHFSSTCTREGLLYVSRRLLDAVALKSGMFPSSSGTSHSCFAAFRTRLHL